MCQCAWTCATDEPGLGKTFATICFLNYILQTTPLCSAARRHLVVVPDSRCLKWHVALQTQCPHVKTVILGLPK